MIAATVPKLHHDMEKQRKVLIQSPSMAKNMYCGVKQKPVTEAELHLRGIPGHGSGGAEIAAEMGRPFYRRCDRRPSRRT
jgi:hypothetical protein